MMIAISKSTAVDRLRNYVWDNTILTRKKGLHDFVDMGHIQVRAWPTADGLVLEQLVREAALADGSLDLLNGEEYIALQISEMIDSPELVLALMALGQTLGLWALNNPEPQSTDTRLFGKSATYAEMGLFSIRKNTVAPISGAKKAETLAQFLDQNTVIAHDHHDLPVIDLGFEYVLVKRDADFDQFYGYVQALQASGLNLLDGHEHGYIEIGGHLNSQRLALQFMAVAVELGLARLMTPQTMVKIDNRSELGQSMLGQGMLSIYFHSQDIEGLRNAYQMSMR